jgi:hypothetical protein
MGESIIISDDVLSLTKFTRTKYQKFKALAQKYFPSQYNYDLTPQPPTTKKRNKHTGAHYNLMKSIVFKVFDNISYIIKVGFGPTCLIRNKCLTIFSLT